MVVGGDDPRMEVWLLVVMMLEIILTVKEKERCPSAGLCDDGNDDDDDINGESRV